MTTPNNVIVEDVLVDAAIEAVAMAHPDKIVHATITTLDDGVTSVSISALEAPLPDKELDGKLVVYHKP